MDTTQIVLIAGILALACTNIITLIWGSTANQKAGGDKPPPKVYNVTIEGTKVFPELDMTKVEDVARQQLLKVVTESSNQLRSSVNKTIIDLGSKINQVADSSLRQETEKYQVSLQGLRESSITEFNKLQTEINTQRSKLLEELTREVSEAQKKQSESFAKELDARLNDIVSSYLTETLGNNVDLGAQTAYIFDALEAHKEQIKQDMQL